MTDFHTNKSGFYSRKILHQVKINW